MIAMSLIMVQLLTGMGCGDSLEIFQLEEADSFCSTNLLSAVDRREVSTQQQPSIALEDDEMNQSRGRLGQR